MPRVSAPRPEARQHHAHPAGPREGDGLRPRQAGRGSAVADAATREIGSRPTDGPRRHRRHARLHVAGAGERAAARRAIRPLFLRRDAGRDDGWAASVPPAIDDGNVFRRALASRRRSAATFLGRDASAASVCWRRMSPIATRRSRTCAPIWRRWPRRPRTVTGQKRRRRRDGCHGNGWRSAPLAVLVVAAAYLVRAFRSLALGLQRRRRRPRLVSFDRLPCFRSTTTRAIPTRTTSPKG